MTDITRRVANHVATSRLGDMPETVLKEARRTLLNWLGCPIGGSRDASVAAALAVADAFSGPRKATVLGRCERLDAMNAAFINGISSSVHTFDDTHLATLIHPAGPIVAALLALAEIRPLAGADFLHAMILGLEIECRLGNMLIAAPAVGKVGWFMTGVTGGIGAAMAVGKALCLSEQQLVWTIGNAVLQASGVRAVHTSMGQSFPTGHAARAGLLAALLAEQGFTSAEHTLEGPKGFARLYADSPHLEALTDRLGEQHEMLLNTYKPYPCGIVIHPAIDACLQALGDAAMAPDKVERIALCVHPLALDLTGRQEPVNSIEAQFSVYHWVAVALIHGAAGVAQGTDGVVRDPAVTALRRRITATTVPGYSRDEASIEIGLRDGRTLSAHVRQCRGSSGRPLSDGEIELKFRQLADPLIAPAMATRLVDLCWTIEVQGDAGDLARACASAVGLEN